MEEQAISYLGYKADLIQGRKEQSIIYPDKSVPTFGPDDEWGHLPEKSTGFSDEFGALTKYNTRQLDDMAKKLLLHLAQRHPELVRLLVLGAGSGVECFNAYSLVKSAHAKIEIETIGMTPISPKIALTQSALEIWGILRNILNLFPKFLTKEEKEFIKSLLKKSTEKRRVPLDFILEIQARFKDAIIAVKPDEAYIKKQYIGRYPQDVDLGSEAQFHMMYDNNGVIKHAENPVLLLENLIPFLHHNGIIFAKKNLKRRLRDFWSDCHNSEKMQDMVIMASKDDFICMRKGSELATAFTDTFNYHEMLNEGFVYCDFLETFVGNLS